MRRSSRPPPPAFGIANALLAGAWTIEGHLAALVDALGARPAWAQALAKRIHARFPEPPHHARDVLAKVLWRERGILREETPPDSKREPLHLRRWPAVPARMSPVVRWDVKRLDTRADLAAWLGLSDGQLDWFADRRQLERAAEEARLQHYRYTWVHKPIGAPRLLEAPKARLKSLQRKILHEILDAIPPNDAVHGFRAGRSVLTHARLHVDAQMVVRFDLEAFFAHVPMARVVSVFKWAGYEEQVARSLAGLCTNTAPQKLVHDALRPRTPHDVQPYFRLRQRLTDFHLPQGAPTSPALANLAAFRLDRRLTALAHGWGLTYSRYADDLAFSGDLHGVRKLERAVAEIARDEGFSLNRAKTRAMPRTTRQQLTGVVVNAHVNVARHEFDRLKALLHNCRVHGVSTQAPPGAPDFREQLRGRIAWVEQLNPRRGAKLRTMFEAIAWP